jgi:hypothetical protein
VLLQPAVLARVKRGKGEVILSQFRWEEALPVEQKSAFVLATLLGNCGAGFTAGVAGRAWTCTPLAAPGTAPLAAAPFVGIKSAVRLLQSASIVRGDVPFSLPAPAGSVAALSAGGAHGLPASFAVNVGARADRVAFLHATAFGHVDYVMGKNVFRYLVTLKQGERTWVEEVNAIYARNVYEYIGDDPGTVNGAAQASRSAEDGVSTYLMLWDNPSPEATIERIEARSLDDKVVALVFGITLMRAEGRQAALARRRTGPFSALELRADAAAEPGRRWAVLGAIPPAERFGLNETARDAEGARDLFDRAFPPEGQRLIDLRAPVFVEGNRFAWKLFVEPEEVDLRGTDVKYRRVAIDDVMDKTFVGRRPAWACYFYTRVCQDPHGGSPRRTAIAFGSDDAGKIWVNGKRVHEIWAGAGREAVLGDDLVFVDLVPGWNDILIKVINTQFSGAFSFDLKTPVPGMEAERRKQGPVYLQNLPALPDTSYDCLGQRGSGDGRATVPRVVSVAVNGESHELEGLASGAVVRGTDGIFRATWTAGQSGGVSAAIPHQGPAFQQGAFGVLLRVPRGKALPKLTLAARNAGGNNRGDTLVTLEGGQPAAGDGSTTGKPYAQITINLERGAGSTPPQFTTTVPLPPGVFPEDTWVPLCLTWGQPGLAVRINGRTLAVLKEDTPLFATPADLVLFPAGPSSAGGELHFQQVLLTDEPLSPEAVEARLRQAGVAE